MNAKNINDQSHIGYNAKGEAVSFVGHDATQLYRAAATKAAIKMHKVCGMIPTRGVTITVLFKIASEFSGKKYKRGEHDKAIADLDVWIQTMKAALPTREV